MTQGSMIGRLSLRRASGRHACAAALSILLAGGILVAQVWPVAADTGDKIGWSAIDRSAQTRIPDLCAFRRRATDPQLRLPARRG